MPDNKPESADPEIPDELRSKLAKSRRPAAYQPVNPEAEELRNKDGELATPRMEEEAPKKLRNTKEFFKQLKAVLKKGPFYRTTLEEREKKVKGEIVIVEVAVKRPVKLGTGEDGLPFVTDTLTAKEIHEVRSRQYADAPKLDPVIGDLTPAFVEWLYLHHPYDAAVRYYARSTHVQVAAAR